MDEFKFFCPGCNQKLSAPMDMVGHEIDCPICEAVITIPAPAEAAPAAPAPAPTPAPAAEADDPFSTTMRLDFKELSAPEPAPPAAPPIPSSPVPSSPVPAPAPAPQPPTLTPQPSPMDTVSDENRCNGCRNPLVVDALGTCVFCGLNYKSGIRIAGA